MECRIDRLDTHGWPKKNEEGNKKAGENLTTTLLGKCELVHESNKLRPLEATC